MTELWDTELIGEGALPTLRDACNRLLEVGKARISLLTIYIVFLASYNQALYRGVITYQKAQQGLGLLLDVKATKN